MGCGGSTPAKADDDRPPKPSPPQQAESPCLGLEDDYAFKQKLGQGKAPGKVQLSPSSCTLSGNIPVRRCFPSRYTTAAGGTGLTYLAEDRKTKELVAIKLIKRPIPKVLEQNILREIVVSTQLATAFLVFTLFRPHVVKRKSQRAAARGVRRHFSFI